jgi:hypothetical protein
MRKVFVILLNYEKNFERTGSAVTRIFGLGGPKNTFLSQMNLILSKLITTLFFYYNDFLQANCTSH